MNNLLLARMLVYLRFFYKENNVALRSIKALSLGIIFNLAGKKFYD